MKNGKSSGQRSSEMCGPSRLNPPNDKFSRPLQKRSTAPYVFPSVKNRKSPQNASKIGGPSKLGSVRANKNK